LFPARAANDLQSDRKTCGGEAAGERDGGKSPDIERAGIAQEQHFARAQQFGILLQFGNRRSRNRRGWSYEEVYVGKRAADFAAYFFQFAAVIFDFRGADIFSFTKAAQGFLLVEFGRLGDELGVIGVGLGSLQGAVGGNVEFDFRESTAQRF
jgi:hypothetical protein